MHLHALTQGIPGPNVLWHLFEVLNTVESSSQSHMHWADKTKTDVHGDWMRVTPREEPGRFVLAF